MNQKRQYQVYQYNIANKNELLNKTENIQLGLRKREYENYFAHKRGICSNKNIPEINISNLIISQNKIIDIELFFQNVT